MSGETETNISGWTTDTLHSHLIQLLKSGTEVVNANQSECFTRVTAVEAHLQRQLDDMQTQLDRRLDREALAVRLAFDSHKEATREAMVASEMALKAALLSAEKAVTTALASAEKAVEKAEMSNEKRFESVNEFRGQLADQVATFPSRIELDSKVESLSDRINGNTERFRTDLQAATARADAQITPVLQYVEQNRGKATGQSQLVGFVVGAAGFVSTVIAIVYALAR